MNIKQVKKDFPIFQRKINGRPIVYLDSASTTQKPQIVIDAVTNVYKQSNANIHRGIYTISEEATMLFEGTREKVKKFINAKSSSEIVFTHNTTEALNLVAYGLSKKLKRGDAILISEMEHHSNIIPWQRVAKERGARLLFLAINDQGVLTNQVKDENDKVVYKHFSEIPNLKVVSLTHVSNVLGTINPIEKIIKQLHLGGGPLRHSFSEASRMDSPEVDPIVVIDAAQSVPHMPVDVQKLNCDFLAFSGHKMLAPTGVGVLYGKRKLLEEMEPMLIGSHMIQEVTKRGATWNTLPWKFEPGTAVIEGVIGLGAAIDYINSIGMERIRKHEEQLIAYSLERIVKIAGVQLYGPTDIKGRGGVLSFNINGVHSHDVAQILDSEGICVRSGHHCAMPLHQRLGIESSARASFYLYNDEEDVDRLIEGIRKVKEVFRSKV